MTRTVVVGASLAGLRCAEELRRVGGDGPITVVGAEAHMPYDRPPLSKRVLTDADADPAALTELPVADDLGVDWVLGTPATGLDLDRRVLHVGTDALAWDRLVIATGARPRRLGSLDGVGGVHLLRTLDDAGALRGDLAAGGARVVVVGAGFVGLEVASSCRARGLDVTVLEAAPVPLERAVGAVAGGRIAERHRRDGTVVETGVTVRCAVTGDDGRVRAVRLGDGRDIPADVVVVGVGVTPSTEWLRGSGVDLDDGVRCDDRLRVLAGGRPVPGVVAAGDVARWGPAGVRHEHWTNAVEQGMAAARTLVGGDAAAPFGDVPYFWSDQTGTKLQMLGTPQRGGDTAWVEDDPDTGRWVLAYGRDGRLVAVLGAGRPARVMRSRSGIEAGAAFPPS